MPGRTLRASLLFSDGSNGEEDEEVFLQGVFRRQHLDRTDSYKSATNEKRYFKTDVDM